MCKCRESQDGGNGHPHPAKQKGPMFSLLKCLQDRVGIDCNQPLGCLHPAGSLALGLKCYSHFVEPEGFSSPSAHRKTKRPHVFTWGLFVLYGALEGIRTPDRLVRSQVLYPAELQARVPDVSSGGAYIRDAPYVSQALFPEKY